MWMLKKVIDRGPREFYRYHTSGTNTHHQPPQEFYWSVSSLAPESYCLHPGADESTRRIFEAARGEP